MRKDLAISAIGHTLVLSLVILGARTDARAARAPAQEPAQACSDAIARDLEPYHEVTQSIWVGDALFMYVQVGKIFNGLVDKDPSIKAAIEGFRRGTMTAWDLRDLLRTKADHVAGFSNSLVRFYQKPFYWHYPVPHVGEGATLDVYYSISDGGKLYELRVDLGGSLQEMNDQLEASAARIIGLRSGVKMTHEGQFAPELASDSAYLHRRGGSASAACLQEYDARLKSLPPQHAEPFDFDNGPAYHASSLGISEGHPATEYPQSEFAGKAGGGSAVGSDSPAPAPSAPGSGEGPPVPYLGPAAPIAPTSLENPAALSPGTSTDTPNPAPAGS